MTFCLGGSETFGRQIGVEEASSVGDGISGGDGDMDATVVWG